jgi:hypothetical protein
MNSPGTVPNRGATSRSPLAWTRFVAPFGAPIGHRWPSVYLLSDDEPSAREVVGMMRRAAELVGNRVIPPFLGVAIPPQHFDELARVVAFVDAHLPTLREPSGRTLMGAGAAAVGTLASGLRHASLFGVVEAWNSAPCDPRLPELLAILQQPPSPLAQRVFLSNTSADARDTAVSTEIADALSRTTRPFALLRGPRPSSSPWWLPQLPRALGFALRSAPWPA